MLKLMASVFLLAFLMIQAGILPVAAQEQIVTIGSDGSINIFERSGSTIKLGPARFGP